MVMEADRAGICGVLFEGLTCGRVDVSCEDGGMAVSTVSSWHPVFCVFPAPAGEREGRPAVKAKSLNQPAGRSRPHRLERKKYPPLQIGSISGSGGKNRRINTGCPNPIPRRSGRHLFFKPATVRRLSPLRPFSGITKIMVYYPWIKTRLSRFVLSLASAWTFTTSPVGIDGLLKSFGDSTTMIEAGVAGSNIKSDRLARTTRAPKYRGQFFFEF